MCLPCVGSSWGWFHAARWVGRCSSAASLQSPDCGSAPAQHPPQREQHRTSGLMTATHYEKEKTEKHLKWCVKTQSQFTGNLFCQRVWNWFLGRIREQTCLELSMAKWLAMECYTVFKFPVRQKLGDRKPHSALISQLHQVRWNSNS